MGKLQTLGDVLGYLEQQTGASQAAAAPAAAATAAPAAGIDLNAMLLDVVADKTGYPVDVLDSSMALEGDLGIDSIKRVEILSALNDRVPGLPEVDASEMGKLQTLGDVLGYLQQQTGSSEAAPAPTTEPSPTASSKSADVARYDVARYDIARYDVARYEVRVVPAPAIGFATAGLTRGTVSIMSDGGGVAEALAATLAQHGVEATVITDALPPADAVGVICLGGLRDLPTDDAARAVNGDTFRIARAVAASMAERGGLFVTVQDTGGDFGLRGDGGRNTWTGGLAALARTASIEWPRAAVKAIDVERGDRDVAAVASTLASELLEGGPELEVGLRADGSRTTLVTEAAEVTVAESAPLTSDDVLVVSGGARGVTAHCLAEVAERWQPRMVLLGRTPLADEPAWAAGADEQPALMRNALTASKAAGDGASPADVKRRVSKVLAGREVRGTLARLKAAGSEVRYDAVDVTDGKAVNALLEAVRSTWGPITGVIHAAGVLADKSIVDKTDDQFDRVFRTKVGGLAGLLEATAGDPLRRLQVFSSVAARYGNGGQCDYAMANAILGNIASREHLSRGGDFRASAMAWGPWNGGMVTPALAAHFDKQGIALIELDAGARACADELASASADTVEVVVGGPKPPAGPADRPGQDARPIEVMVDSTSYPYLAGHRVKNVAVVPVVLALEWFTRAARSLFPTLRVVNCRDLKVLKGIRLDHFDAVASDVFSIRWRQVSNGTGATLAMELVGPGDVRHYSGVVELAHDAKRGARYDGAAMELEPLKVAAGSLYGDKLFHGAEFAVIRAVDGVGSDGGEATLSGTREMGWRGEAWQTDAAALDGGLQLAILWGDHVLGRSSLPTRVGTYTPHTDTPVEGPIRCVLTGKSARGERTVSDIAFVADDGSLVAELTDVEMHLLPKS